MAEASPLPSPPAGAAELLPGFWAEPAQGVQVVDLYGLGAVAVVHGGDHGQVVVKADGELGGLKLLGKLVGDIDVQNVVLVGVGVDLKVLVPLEVHAHVVLIQFIAAVHQGGEGKGAS